MWPCLPGRGKCVSAACTCFSPTDELPAAIAAASPGATITLGVGTYRANAIIDKDLTLIGAGAGQTILDGRRNGHVLSVGVISGPTVVVLGLTITGGEASQGGGIINFATVKLIDARVAGNTARSRAGGGIFNRDSTLSIADETIVTDNNPDNCTGDSIPATRIG